MIDFSLVTLIGFECFYGSYPKMAGPSDPEF